MRGNSGGMRHPRTQELAIDPAATGLAWWELYDDLSPGTSALARRLKFNRTSDYWEPNANYPQAEIFDRPSGPGGVAGQVVGAIYLPTSRAWEIVVSQNWQWARLITEDLDALSTGQATIYTRNAEGWAISSLTVTVQDVQLAAGQTIPVDSLLTIEWSPFNPLVTTAPFGEWLIRTSSCEAIEWPAEE